MQKRPGPAASAELQPREQNMAAEKSGQGRVKKRINPETDEE
ncbi:hypothetical protein [Allomeiothermus silvanus]|nr:hypothetical protein [Allomeiothermus silvanus]